MNVDDFSLNEDIFEHKDQSTNNHSHKQTDQKISKLNTEKAVSPKDNNVSKLENVNQLMRNVLSERDNQNDHDNYIESNSLDENKIERRFKTSSTRRKMFSQESPSSSCDSNLKNNNSANINSHTKYITNDTDTHEFNQKNEKDSALNASPYNDSFKLNVDTSDIMIKENQEIENCTMPFIESQNISVLSKTLNDDLAIPLIQRVRDSKTEISSNTVEMVFEDATDNQSQKDKDKSTVKELEEKEIEKIFDKNHSKDISNSFNRNYCFKIKLDDLGKVCYSNLVQVKCQNQYQPRALLVHQHGFSIWKECIDTNGKSNWKCIAKKTYDMNLYNNNDG